MPFVDHTAVVPPTSRVGCDTTGRETCNYAAERSTYVTNTPAHSQARAYTGIGLDQAISYMTIFISGS